MIYRNLYLPALFLLSGLLFSLSQPHFAAAESKSELVFDVGNYLTENSDFQRVYKFEDVFLKLITVHMHEFCSEDSFSGFLVDLTKLPKVSTTSDQETKINTEEIEILSDQFASIVGFSSTYTLVKNKFNAGLRKADGEKAGTINADQSWPILFAQAIENYLTVRIPTLFISSEPSTVKGAKVLKKDAKPLPEAPTDLMALLEARDPGIADLLNNITLVYIHSYERGKNNLFV